MGVEGKAADGIPLSAVFLITGYGMTKFLRGVNASV